MRHTALSLKRVLALSTVLGLVLPSCALAAAGQADDEMLSPKSLGSSSAAADGQNELQSMLERVRRMKCYSFDSTLTTYTGGKPFVEIGKLYFKAPNLIRFEVIKSGSHSGSIVVRQADGKIRGQMGGMLSGIKVTLSPDSKLLETGNGFNLIQSDLESLLERAERKVKGDLKCLAVGPAAGHSKVVEILESDGDVVDRIAEDSKNKVPSEWNIFSASKLFSTLQINNLQIADLADDLFTLADNTSSKDLGTTLVAGYPFLDSLTKGSGNLVMAYGEIARITKHMNEITRHLTDNVATADGNWKTNARENMLTALAEIEALRYNLKPVGSAIQASEAKVFNHDLSNSWNKAMSDCHDATDQLIDSVWEAKPDMTTINSASTKLKNALSQLESANKDILDLP